MKKKKVKIKLKDFDFLNRHFEELSADELIKNLIIETKNALEQGFHKVILKRMAYTTKCYELWGEKLESDDEYQKRKAFMEKRRDDEQLVKRNKELAELERLKKKYEL